MNFNQYLMSLDKQDRAIKIKVLADRLDVSTGSIRHWSNNIRKPTAEHARLIEKLTKGAVTRHELRPDIYSAEDL
jgi:DNA-binding transcriptional regulator YdaS (Cro superfamily)